jgi:hypothetical protein
MAFISLALLYSLCNIVWKILFDKYDLVWNSWVLCFKLMCILVYLSTLSRINVIKFWNWMHLFDFTSFVCILTVFIWLPFVWYSLFLVILILKGDSLTEAVLGVIRSVFLQEIWYNKIHFFITMMYTFFYLAGLLLWRVFYVKLKLSWCFVN